eukprot:144978-Pelagomonas_calceolata.AAC.1
MVLELLPPQPKGYLFHDTSLFCHAPVLQGSKGMDKRMKTCIQALIWQLKMLVGSSACARNLPCSRDMLAHVAPQLEQCFGSSTG